jgi:hypothetical protein
MPPGERFIAVEMTLSDHEERLTAIETTPKWTLGTFLEGKWQDIKWWLLLFLLLGGKVALPPVVDDILKGAGFGGLGFG